jgi:hypothetical protein
MEGRWLGNVRLTEVTQARRIVDSMMPSEGKVDAQFLSPEAD